MGSEPEEIYGMWSNINHPYIEVEDTAVAVIRFKNGALANIMLSNAQKPGLYAKVHIHGSNGASVGVQTDGGSMFLPGQSGMAEPPLNDVWTIADEATLLADWQASDTSLFQSVNPVEYFVRLQHEDFIQAIIKDTSPLVTAREGRKTVALFQAIYESQRDKKPVRWK
jgi:predicted dehydrogenase